MGLMRGRNCWYEVAGAALVVSALSFAAPVVIANTAKTGTAPKPWYSSIKPLDEKSKAAPVPKAVSAPVPAQAPAPVVSTETEVAPEKISEPPPVIEKPKAVETTRAPANDDEDDLLTDEPQEVSSKGSGGDQPPAEVESAAKKSDILPRSDETAGPAPRAVEAGKKRARKKLIKVSAIKPRETLPPRVTVRKKSALISAKAAKVPRSERKAPDAVDKNEPWYKMFWPLGKRVKVASLKDEYIPFNTDKGVRGDFAGKPNKSNKAGKADFAVAHLPGRPSLLFEAGNGFLDTGKLHEGFEVPLIGAVWQPRLWVYLINRTAFQTFDAGTPGVRRETELANRLDIFANLQLTGTEKILLGLRPLDNNRPNRFSRYTFSGASKGYNDELNVGLETLFFEGDLGSLFPVFDKGGFLPLDFGFTVGRQPLVFQEGILINDTVDAVGFVRNNIRFPGTSNVRISGMWGWNRLDRNDRPGKDEDMFGLFIAADTHVSTYNLDVIYVNDGKGRSDGLYIGASAIQRLSALGGISTAFRINSSFALEDEIPGNVVGNGTLITAEISKTVKGSDDIVYFNPFLGIGNYTQAGREAIVGGPLANTGILFASPSLSTFLAEINPFTGDDVVGAAVGYQAFWDHKRRNLILEVAGRHDLGGKGFDTLGLGFQLQQALGRRVQLTFESFYAFNEGRNDGAGARAEVQVVY